MPLMPLPTTDRPFYTFLREERQFSFLLAFLLMQKGTALDRFIALVNAQLPPEVKPLGTDTLDDAEIYVEFAYLRDQWDSTLTGERSGGRTTTQVRQRANEAKRAFIRSLFDRVPSLAALASSELPAETADFNAFFGANARGPITNDIASPALWSVRALAAKFGSSPEVFLDLCRLKWSFHIKPDVVIRIPGIAPLCIETKLESNEGTYPTGADATAFDSVFAERVRVRQFELQQFMFELIGEPCIPIVIQKLYPRAKPAWPVLIWGEVLSSLVAGDPLQNSIPFVSRLVGENASLLSSYAEHRMNGGG